MDERRDGAEGEGGTIPGAGTAAFTLTLAGSAPVPVLISVPHAGHIYPPALAARMRDPGYAALRLEDRRVDVLGQAVAKSTGAGLLVAHAPRAMIDLNRAEDDVDWSMVAGGAPTGARHSLANRRARGGLGIVPRRVPGLGEIWRGRLDRAELDARIAAVHRPYHAVLASALEALRDRWGAVLLIDLHSMPPLPRGPGAPAAEFIIGDRFGASCSRELASASLGYLAANGRVAAHNRPYAGGYVLDRHAAPARGIHALQLEVCRASYLDARLAEPSVRAAGVARLLSGLVRTLAGEVAALGGGERSLLAAE